MSSFQLHEIRFNAIFHRLTIACIAVLLSLHVNPSYGQSEPTPEKSSHPPVTDSGPAQGEWIQLFNGKDINDWIVKLHHHAINDNYRDTFRVEHGLLNVR